MTGPIPSRCFPQMVAVLALLAGLAAAATSAAVPPHPAVRVAAPPAWVDETAIDPSSEPALPEGASSSVAYLLVDLQLRLDGERTVQYSRIATRVLTAAGLSLAAEDELGFDPDFQTLVLHHLRVFRDGRWHDRMDQAQITVAQRESDFSRRIYDGSLSVLSVLGDVRVGDVVDVAYSIEGFNPVFGGRTYAGVSMAWHAPVATRRVRVLRRPETPLGVRGFAGADDEAVVRPLGDLVEDEWLLSDLPAVDWESGAPPDWEAYPWLQLSEFGSWTEVVDWARPLYRVPASSRAAVAARARELAAEADDPASRALAAIRFVQDELRYFAIVLGPNSHAPHPPEVTLERRFGDCKDKALLLVALLEELGIPAWPALVDSDTGPLVPTRLPSPGVFDHIVVVLEIDGEQRWVDPTISLQGGTLATTAIPDYGHGLVLRAGETSPVAIPSEQTDPGWVSAEYSYDFEDDGATALVEITTEYAGLEADDLRYDLADTTLEQLQDGYVAFYSSSSGRVVPQEPLRVSDDRTANRIVTRELYRLEDWWSPVDGVPTFELLPLLSSSLLATEDLTDRRAPLDLPRRTRRTEAVQLRAPEDWALEGVDVETGKPWFDYRVTSTRDGAALLMNHELTVADRAVEPHEIPGYNQAILELVDATSYAIVDDPDDAGGAGDTVPALVAIAVVIAVAAAIFAVVGWLLARWRLL
ncbi:MAG TPA: DUF3857 domain-containing protein [Methylomirabilota bacterium]|nr:DUF3857 domain-containing protein [Methylomirabilota bacterium]